MAVMRELYRKLLGAVALALLAAAPAAAAPTACPAHFAGGHAPDPLRPSLAAKARELCYEGFAVLHSGVSRTPLWSAERLTRAAVEAAGPLGRVDRFRAEPRLPPDERAELADYRGSGLDRGHLAPAGDMATAQAQAESFSLANMAPQDPDLNRGRWERVEDATRKLAARHGEAYVVTGVAFRGEALRRVGGRVLVPTHLFKAVYVPGRGAAAYVAGNAPGRGYSPVPVAEVEALTGFAVFPGMPAADRGKLLALPAPKERKRR